MLWCMIYILSCHRNYKNKTANPGWILNNALISTIGSVNPENKEELCTQCSDKPWLGIVVHISRHDMGPIKRFLIHLHLVWQLRDGHQLLPFRLHKYLDHLILSIYDCIYCLNCIGCIYWMTCLNMLNIVIAKKKTGM